jgi:hypothetical protein
MSGCSEPPLHGYNLNVFIKATGGPQPPDIKFTDLKPVPPVSDRCKTYY